MRGRSLNFHRASLEVGEPWHVEAQMYDILSEYLQMESSASATDAAESIDRLTPMTRTPLADEEVEEPISFLLETWGLFFAMAQ